MDVLKREDISRLLDETFKICVSIYMPTHPTGREQQQDPIRLKNLLKRAEEELLNQGWSTPGVQELLEPAEKLLVDPVFWKYQNDGLALFLADKFARHYRLPRRFEELIIINQRFHTKPLLPLLSYDGKFYILALSKNDTKLYQATKYSINQVDLSGIPTNLDEALWFDDPEKHLQYHTSTESPVSTSGDRAAIYHGHAVKNDEKTNILRFFQHLDSELGNILKNDTTPLLLAGVDYLQPLYREANTYPFLLDQGVPTNIDELNRDRVHRTCWDVVAPIFEESHVEAENRFLMLIGQKSRLASLDLEVIVQAAYYGAVETLFVALNIQKWGTFDKQKGVTDVHAKARPGDTDLLDFAALHTFKNSGTVYAVDSDQVPGGGLLTAIFRYQYAPAQTDN